MEMKSEKEEMKKMETYSTILLVVAIILSIHIILVQLSINENNRKIREPWLSQEYINSHGW